MNKNKSIRGIIMLAFGMIVTSHAFAQTPGSAPDMSVAEFLINPKFLVTIIAGVIMSFGFQLILTNLSVALGITAMGNLNERNNVRRRNRREVTEYREEEGETNSATMPKFMSMAGLWSIITSAVSLFLGSMLAVKLSLVNNDAIGFTLGLVIWGVFTLTMIYLESRAIGSFISNLWGMAINAIKASFSGISSVVSKSESQKTKDIADTVKEEVYQFMNETDLGDKMNDIIEKVRPKYDLTQFRHELADLLNDLKIEQKAGETSREKESYLRVAEKQPYFSKTDVTNLEQVFESVLARIGLSGVSKQAGGLGAKASNYIKEEYVPRIKDEVTQYMMERSTPSTNPEIVRAEIDEIFEHGILPEYFVNHKGQLFDKNNVAEVVAEQKHVSREEAIDVADQLENALNSVLSASNIKEMAGPKLNELKEGVREKFVSGKEQVVSNLDERFENLFNRINRPELDYQLLKKEFQFMLRNPSLAPEVMKTKLKQMDSDTLVALLTATGQLNKEEANNVINKFEEVKSSAIKKLDDAQQMIKEKTEETVRAAREQSEKLRKMAMAASWWFFIMLLVSGAASGIGGMIGM